MVWSMIFSFRMVEQNGQNILGLILMFTGDVFRALSHIAKNFSRCGNQSNFPMFKKHQTKISNLSRPRAKNLCASAHTGSRVTFTIDTSTSKHIRALPERHVHERRQSA